MYLYIIYIYIYIYYIYMAARQETISVKVPSHHIESSYPVVRPSRHTQSSYPVVILLVTPSRHTPLVENPYQMGLCRHTLSSYQSSYPVVIPTRHARGGSEMCPCHIEKGPALLHGTRPYISLYIVYVCVCVRFL